ncbi:hypothetical protein [Magnetospirillum sulfuroxidans]|uniref:Cytochrome c domain-containing protein n=1 Tax=Magnetospirillum sulfuroxidans TaxID=611300 RepID=A0ABS5I783_9PROT|nr:hypothetical protein [Magnetospirillum sulfuroxidans]MBR9970281.1 hypothetical protein [Magnetospirillum sulfuroxidans]
MPYKHFLRVICAASLLSGAAQAAQAESSIWGADLPVPAIPGYAFPEPEATLMGWVNGGSAADNANIYLHGWGLWDALTTPSTLTVYGIQNAPVYLTWVTKQELVAMSKTSGKTLFQATAPQRKLRLSDVTQLSKFGVHSMQPKAMPELKAANGITPDTSVLETVTYDPVSGQTINDRGYFKLATIQQVYTSKQPEIAAFPEPSVVVKPVYKVISAKTLYQNRYYVMPAWPGTPAVTPTIEKNGFPESSWNGGCVYVDTQNTGTSTANAVDPSCSGPSAATTYGLGDFVHYTLTAQNAAFFDVANTQKVVAGDTLLLMAMHVSTREMTEWTWQTFFWTPDPANPPLPSSTAIAAAIPAQLTGAPAHYAGSFAYAMVSPNQPINGGKSVGQPVVGYNPYLESDFGANVFGLTRPIVDGSQSWTGTVGVQTNCMTCHALAAVAFSKTAQTAYATDFYIARDDPFFAGTVQTEFLWSIADVVSSQQTQALQKTFKHKTSK